MRNVRFYMIILLGFTSACFSQRDFVAEYDYNYSGNFKRYRTFGFVEEKGKDTTSFKGLIEKTITSRLGSQGFRQQPEKPDLLITYKLFLSDVKYRGYIQPEFDYWLRKQGVEIVENEELDSLERRKLGEDYKRVKYTENDGMLVIFVIDNKKGNTIWQGYTSAYFDYTSPNIQMDLTRATYKVMDQFRVLTR